MAFPDKENHTDIEQARGGQVLALCHRIGEFYRENPTLIKDRARALHDKGLESYSDAMLTPAELELRHLIGQSFVSSEYKNYLDRLLFSQKLPDHLVRDNVGWEDIPDMFLGIDNENDRGIWTTNTEVLEPVEILAFMNIELVFSK